MLKQIDDKVKSLRFSAAVDEKLTKLALKNGLTKLEFFMAMVDYFYKSKKDPKDLNDEVLKADLKKKTDNILGFFKQMETMLLFPMKKDSETIRKQTAQNNLLITADVVQHNKRQAEAYQKQSERTERIYNLLVRLERAQLDKATLKEHFAKILEDYIAAREQMGMLTKQSERDALNRQVRQQLLNL